MLDLLIAKISPQRALNRSTARMKLRYARNLEQKQIAALRMDAGKKDRTTHDWPANPLGPDSAILPDAATVNARARHAKDNTWQGAAIASAYRRNVICTGITARSTAVIQGESESERKRIEEFRRRLDRSFTRWARTPIACDVEGRETLNDKMALLVEDRKFVGSGFLVWSIDPGLVMPGAAVAPLKVQGFEWEQLATEKDRLRPNARGEYVRHGLRFSAHGRLLGCYVHVKKHPQDGYTVGRSDPQYIRAERLMHYATRTRFGQTLPPSELAPVLLKLWRNNQYDDHEQLAKQIEAFIAFSIQLDPRFGPPNLGTPPNGTGVEGGGDGADLESGEHDQSYRDVNLSPGQVPVFANGEQLVMHNPTRPGPNYPDYMKTQAMMIAAGSDMSSSAFLRKFEGTYVNGRMSTNDDNKTWDMWQMQVVDYVLRPLRNRYTSLAVLNNIDGLGLLAPDYFDSESRMQDYQEAEYMGARREPIDPAKQAAADAIALEYFLDTRGRILNRRGELVVDLFEDTATQKALADRMNIPLPEFLAQLAKSGQSKPKTHGTGDGGAAAAASSRRELSMSLVEKIISNALEESEDETAR